MGVTVVPAKAEDSRRCMFCHSQGDGTADGPARLLNFDVDKWVHLNCALWSENVYETVNGALMNLDTALQHSLVLNCIVCEKPGATVKCFKMRCTNVYHLGCAVKDGCVFYKNKVKINIKIYIKYQVQRIFNAFIINVLFYFRVPIALNMYKKTKKITN